MMIGFGISGVNFVTEGSFFVVTSFVSSGSQKKVYSEVDFGCRHVEDAVIFDEEMTWFVFLASGFQRKDRSETSFIRGVTGDEMSFVGGAI